MRVKAVSKHVDEIDPRLAWQEAIENVHNPEIITADKNHKQFVDKAVRFGRTVTMFGILPALLFAVASTLENINSLRPHGTTGSMLFMSGILYLLMFIFHKTKLRQFTSALLHQNFVCIKYHS